MLVKRNAPAPAQDGDRDAKPEDLDAADPALRRRAAQALRRRPEAVEALCRRLAIEPEHDVRGAILSNLIGQKSSEIADRLAALFDASGAALRNEVMEALWAMPEESLGAMARMLEDDDRRSRLLAVNVLSETPDPRAVELLEHVLAHEPDVNICLAAIDGLAHGDNFRSASRLAQFAARFPDVEQAQFVVQALLRSIGAPT